MTYFWIRPLCRFFGLMFLAFGVTGGLSSVIYLSELLGIAGGGGSRYPIPYIVEAIARPAAYLAIGAWLFWGARGVERLVCRGLHPPGCCPRCGYNLAPSGLARCPECGHEAARPATPDAPA